VKDMRRKKHICFFTGKRGGFNHLVPVIEAICREEDLEYSIIAADMHLSGFFGNTIDEVKEQADNVYTVETLMNSDSRLGRAKSIGIGILGMSELLAKLKPDLIFVLGDRGEVLGMAICALEMNIPIIHLFGGDVCQGGVDEPVRHAITKLASIHLTSNEESAERIRRMGEETWRVHNVGSPVLDLIEQHRYAGRDATAQRFGLDSAKPIILLLQHSVTWQVEDAEYQMRQTMEAIDHFGFQTVAVYPCSDPGFEAIIRVLLNYEGRPYLQVHRNIPFQDFWGLMSIASLFLGNSSAGVMETPSFRIPFVNVGIRQEGRLRAENVIDVGHEKEEIIKAIERAMFDREFRERVRACRSPYGDGKTSSRIVSILKDLGIDENLIRKRMTY
jgi:GDP/UDP-N,N'-diacetylbacillosamine 2-epimerase (hydrolysing)